LELAPQADLEISGFEVGEIDMLLDGRGLEQEDELPEIENGATPVTRMGDLWVLGEHRLLCGDALRPDSYARVLGTDKADMMFADAPYNLPVEGHVSGLGTVKHTNFAMASGELSSVEFHAFLRTSLGHAASQSIDGAVHYVCMDWRHQREIIAAGEEVYSQLLNLCIWNKSNAGMGSLYRSKHELIFVFKVGKEAHVNNILLGRHGRHRTNVWDYISQNALNGTRKSKLAWHPTCKPVAMVADAMQDCSNRGGLILDPFGGAGTTVIAAERTGRRARVIELNPTFVDVSIKRWQRLTGGTALNDNTGEPFVHCAVPAAKAGGSASVARRRSRAQTAIAQPFGGDIVKRPTRRRVIRGGQGS
jgi:DNA modification methylase